MKLKFKKLVENAVLPRYAKAGDSGMDICSAENVTVHQGGFKLIRSGIAAEIPDGYEIQVRPRSGLAAKNGVVTAFGTVDSGYRGDIGIILFNHGNAPLHVAAGDRIAQLVVQKVERVEVEEVAELGVTERGADGFGSTGVN